MFSSYHVSPAEGAAGAGEREPHGPGRAAGGHPAGRGGLPGHLRLPGGSHGAQAPEVRDASPTRSSSRPSEQPIILSPLCPQFLHEQDIVVLLPLVLSAPSSAPTPPPAPPAPHRSHVRRVRSQGGPSHPTPADHDSTYPSASKGGAGLVRPVKSTELQRGGRQTNSGGGGSCGRRRRRSPAAAGQRTQAQRLLQASHGGRPPPDSPSFRLQLPPLPSLKYPRTSEKHA